MTAECTYLGAEERIYSGYLTTSHDGESSTLIGTPGMPPAVVVRAAGNERLPEIPADGMWVSADQPATDSPSVDAPAVEGKPAKTGKAVTS